MKIYLLDKLAKIFGIRVKIGEVWYGSKRDLSSLES